eukprot:5033834-Prymnesium_polylepis.1
MATEAVAMEKAAESAFRLAPGAMEEVTLVAAAKEVALLVEGVMVVVVMVVVVKADRVRVAETRVMAMSVVCVAEVTGAVVMVEGSVAMGEAQVDKEEEDAQAVVMATRAHSKWDMHICTAVVALPVGAGEAISIPEGCEGGLVLASKGWRRRRRWRNWWLRWMRRRRR